MFNVVTGTGEGLGAALVSHPVPRLITLTGSVRAGKEIFRNGAEDLKILRLELGGKAPFIVGEDADIGAAVKAAVASRFENCGQICICNERMYVHERIADEFMEKFVNAVSKLKVGNPLEPVDVGPKFSAAELTKVERMVEAATKAGAKVLTGGRRLTDGEFARGYWYRAHGHHRARQPAGDHAARGLRPGHTGHDRHRFRRRAETGQRIPATASRPMSSPRTCGG